MFRPVAVAPPLALALLVAMLGLGLISALLAEWPLWALKEWGRYVGLIILALLLGAVARKPQVAVAVLGLMAAIGFLHAFQFIVYYSAAFISGIQMLQADLLFNGFANPRFFAQFQILLMPVLACLILQLRQGRPVISLLLTGALAVQWCIGLILGGRGLWLGLVVSAAVLLMTAPRYWRLIAIQLGAGLLGGLLFILLFYLIPAWLDIAPDLRDSLRTSMSGRERIWLWAWEMAQANPWLGVGPMHYSATYNPIAAHPHQVILQWAAEWGLPATLMALVLGCWGMVFGISRLRNGEFDNTGAALWLAIAGALVLAQVDGVFVMPYAETWLAILIGLALARWSSTSEVRPVQRLFFQVLAIPVVLIIGDVLINEVPTLLQDTEAYMEKHHTDWTPRFWGQGWIPMDEG
ncbi:MAG: O-antigen ligase family protein [Pseudomonas sp.]